jgi:dTMP kinase
VSTGLFIAFEGGEGAGKSTQAARLAQALRDRGVDVVLTREPGATVLGARLRELLLGEGAEVPAKRAEALLYAADRAHHAATVLRPALERGAVVLCDRYIGSSLAYQANGNGLDYDMIKTISLWGADGLYPHRTFLLDLPVEVGLMRAKARGDANRFDNADLAFHHAVRTSFRHQATASSWTTVDATKSADEVFEVLLDQVLDEARWFGHVGAELRELRNQ